MNDSLTQFDILIKGRSLLTHPFYAQRWNNGELTLEELQVYAKEYFHLAKRIPGIVSRVRDRAVEKRPDLVPAIEENIQEETEHIDLWKRFAKSLGVSEEEMEHYEPTKQVKGAVSTLEKLAEGSFEDGVATMYAMELELPTISQTKKEGLCKFYGLESEDAHIYFDEHLNEEKHFDVWRQVKIDPVRAEKVVDKALAAQHKVLDGVSEKCGLCTTC